MSFILDSCCRLLGNKFFSQDLTPSGYYIFGPMKEGLRGKPYASDEEVKTAVMKWFKEQSAEFCQAGIHALIQRQKKNGDYVEM